MAVVGPLLLDGVYAKGEFSVPLCTLEGTLAKLLEPTLTMSEEVDRGLVQENQIKMQYTPGQITMHQAHQVS